MMKCILTPLLAGAALLSLTAVGHAQYGPYPPPRPDYDRDRPLLNLLREGIRAGVDALQDIDDDEYRERYRDRLEERRERYRDRLEERRERLHERYEDRDVRYDEREYYRDNPYGPGYDRPYRRYYRRDYRYGYPDFGGQRGPWW